MSYLLTAHTLLPSPLLRHPYPSSSSPSIPTRISLPQTLASPDPTHNEEEKIKRKPSIRARLCQLCKDGRLDAARRLFDGLPRPVPTLIWNTLLIGYVCNSMPRHALQFYALMNHASASYSESDPYTYSSALKACADARCLTLGKSIHCHVVRRRPTSKNQILNNSLLNMYASSTLFDNPNLDVVRILFDRMPKKNVVAWNTIISWYSRTHRPDHAFELFRRMITAGVRPTVVSFINVFPAGHENADALYSLLIKHGSEFVDDVFVVSSAISMYSDLSDVRSARRVFDRAAEKNIEVWNTMIGGYVQNDLFKEALTLFAQVMESKLVAPDSVTFLESLMAASQLQDLELGRQIHAILAKLQLLPLIVSNAMIVMYSRCGCIQSSFEVFHRMTERDTVSWNTMISAFVQKGLDLEGLMLFLEMQKEGFLVDSVAVTALLSAASNLSSLRIGKETHGYLVRHGIHCRGLESYLVDMYAKSGCVDTARMLFDGDLDPFDRVTWNAMIAGHTQSGQAEQALLLFRKMLDEEMVPNSVTVSSVLPACRGIQDGRQIHGFAIRFDLDGNTFVGTALVDMYSKCGGIVYAERVFDSMTEKNTVTYTTMISGLGQHGLGERSLYLFQAMQESGVKPDAITFVAVISACSYSGMVDEGLSVYNSMGGFGITPTPEHHCCIVDLLGRAGRVEEAYQFVRGLGETGNFVGIWGSLLASCRIHEEYEMGELVSKKVFELQGGEAGYRVLLSNVYASEGKWGSVDRVRKEMREQGVRKEPGSSWIGVGDASHRFVSKDQNHPENEQIYTMLQELDLEMRGSDADLNIANAGGTTELD